MLTSGEQAQAIRGLVGDLGLRQDSTPDRHNRIGRQKPSGRGGVLEVQRRLGRRELRPARRRASSRGGSALRGVSSISAGRRDAGSMPICCSSARRRGEAEASTSRAVGPCVAPIASGLASMMFRSHNRPEPCAPCAAALRRPGQARSTRLIRDGVGLVNSEGLLQISQTPAGPGHDPGYPRPPASKSRPTERRGRHCDRGAASQTRGAARRSGKLRARRRPRS